MVRAFAQSLGLSKGQRSQLTSWVRDWGWKCQSGNAVMTEVAEGEQRPCAGRWKGTKRGHWA